jgi:D-alanyl-D-alanine carboxypeptidase/D-alanyl-D-alanine-endopeptidase (penicillin-binding protein 4)
VLAEQAPDQLFTPASVQKLIVGAAALHLLGPEYRVSTQVHGSAPDADGTVHGDLLLVGRGDPTWNRLHFEDNPRTPLHLLAAGLWERGVRRVEGDLVVDGSAFPGRETPPDWPVGDLSFRYGAVPSALAVDRNAMPLSMAPGRKVGDPVRVETSAPIELLNLAVTAPAELHGNGTVEFQMQWDRPTIVIRGEFPISEPAFEIQVATPQPLEVFAHELAAALVGKGIEWTGELRVLRTPSEAAAWAAGQGVARDDTLLARLISPPLAEWLDPLLGDSDNWYAEMILRVLALELRGAGRLEFGLDVEREFLTATVGADEAGFDLDDASGLSPFNLLSPRTVVALLQWAMNQDWFPLFEASLANDRQGTLSRSWGQVSGLHAKTGSLTHVQTLAGYDRSLGGEPTVFAVFSNGRAVARRDMKRDILAQIRSWRPIARQLDLAATATAGRE